MCNTCLVCDIKKHFLVTTELKYFIMTTNGNMICLKRAFNKNYPFIGIHFDKLNKLMSCLLYSIGPS